MLWNIRCLAIDWESRRRWILGGGVPAFRSTWVAGVPKQPQKGRFRCASLMLQARSGPCRGKSKLDRGRALWFFLAGLCTGGLYIAYMFSQRQSVYRQGALRRDFR
jgi:hypothetical protein